MHLHAVSVCVKEVCRQTHANSSDPSQCRSDAGSEPERAPAAAGGTFDYQGEIRWIWSPRTTDRETERENMRKPQHDQSRRNTGNDNQTNLNL